MNRFFLVAGFGLLTASGASAQSVCRSYEDTTVNPISIDAALNKFKTTATKKDEFETTAQFQARQLASIGGANSTLIISKPVDPQYIKYDADTQIFSIETYLFDNTNINYDVFGYPKPIPYGTLGNTDVAIVETDTPAGSYEATNSYGAKATVTKINRVTKGIWDSPYDSIIGGLFDNGGKSTLLSVKLEPEKARSVKSQISIAFVVVPKSPYIVTGSGPVGKTTVSRPIEINNNVTILVADIQCALLLGAGNKVLGSFPTN